MKQQPSIVAVDSDWLQATAAAALVHLDVSAFLIACQRGEFPAGEWRQVKVGNRWTWRKCWKRIRLELAAMGQMGGRDA